jgi:hypothetical protein
MVVFFYLFKSSSKGLFSSSVNINTKATAKDAYSAYQQDLAQQQAQLQDLQAKLEADIGFIEHIDIDEMLVLLLAVRLMSPSVAVKLTPVRLMLPCGGLGGLLSGWLVGLLSDWLAGLLLAWLVGLAAQNSPQN